MPAAAHIPRKTAPRGTDTAKAILEGAKFKVILKKHQLQIYVFSIEAVL
jgi:hypothetical protein